MKVIGLCGGSGSGKGAVSRAFLSLGIPFIDADAVYHSLTSELGPCLDELVSEFGASIVKDGALDRNALREIVFSGDNASIKQSRLNSITHKYVLLKIRSIIDEYAKDGVKGVIVDAPLLFESGFDSECDHTISVTADQNLRIARIMLRDKITYEQAYRRISLQKSDAWLLKNTDFNILNEGSLEELGLRVKEIYSTIFDK